VKAQRQLVRERLGVVHDPRRARAVAAEAIRSAAEAKNNPPDLINVALEMLVKASLELPGFSTLDAMTGRIRREVNTIAVRRRQRAVPPSLLVLALEPPPTAVGRLSRRLTGDSGHPWPPARIALAASRAPPGRLSTHLRGGRSSCRG
jgi:hypothetical protein